MKTGGTLNFLKKAGAIFMLLAIFASSCNKYADDFKQINTKLDALATQVAGVTQLTTDLASVKSSITTLQTAIAALPTTASVSALATSLTALSTKVDGITTTLNTVATAGTATKAVVDQLKLDLAALNTKVTADNATLIANTTSELAKLTALGTQVTAVQTALTALDAKSVALATAVAGNGTAIAANATALAAQAAQLTTLAADLTAFATASGNADAANAAANAAIAAQNVATQAQATLILAALADANTQAAADQALTTAAIAGLKVQLEAAQASLNSLLANSNMNNGDVNITSDAEVAFWLPKIGVWIGGGMVNGNLTINTTTISAGKMADLKTITDNIIAVIGGVGKTTDITAKAGDNLTFAKLSSVTGDYKVTGADVDDSQLLSVGGILTADYDGGYSFPQLASAPSVVLNDYKTNTATANKAVGTLTVDFSGLTTNLTDFKTASTTVGQKGQTVAYAAAAQTVIFSSATSVSIGSGPRIIALTADAASTVTVNTKSDATLASLTVSATKAGSAITLGGKDITGALSVTGSATSTVSLPNLATVGTTTGVTALTLSAPNVTTLTGVVTLTNTTPVSLPKLATAGTITAATATAFSAPLLNVSAALTLAAAIDVNVLSSTQALLAAAVVENLTLGGLDATFTTSATSTLKTVNVTGKVSGSGVFTYTVPAAVGNSLLNTATFGGELDAVTINGFGTSGDKLTSLTTTGAIDAFTLNNSDVITAVSLGHSHIAGGAGSVLVITNNAKLASLTTSTNMLKTLTVTGNALLASANFASYTTIVNSGAVAVTVTGNKLGGVFTPAVAITPTTPYVEATITSADLATLKPFFAAWAVAHTAPAASSATITMQLGLDGDVRPDLANTQVLLSITDGSTVTTVGQLSANEAVSAVIDDVDTLTGVAPNKVLGSTVGISSTDEFKLIQ